ncbi:UDP-N-acetylmuramoylalanyl-D-glutamate--2,6-diaminopimelate ligase [Porphyromonas canoris]|uniref:UDP-N-acetylmuramoyl-L-alanyl-D-glutamate--2,6-diaminopimelate ligase n=1 Tax=Porphyromonas canoris TaxID=36875 RepID=A0ABR4XM49_9PORP|nr:UDP-N-acetylmuramoyl-L-alanyl-D-glutamate--2,6-diaminopimelate ligase [Porphyromonas canoris]KGL51915.1 UDP-N-acetylmuramoylalanyl-D-glutamate--2,6-diaminopimelate ligase [Porphyromonas canoris]KGN93111.1 UDP-N-acetylmuramoylalanyl-D-glutamate--2,6-diaminopimelate ligase [Porphyromonas canoris]
MTIQQLFKGIPHEQLADVGHIEIKGIQSDSRKVNSGDLFVAIRGTISDGHDFICQAVEKGAVAILCEELPEYDLPEEIAIIRTEHTDVVVGMVAANFYGHPSDKIKLVGVTGTNGKTTTATLLYEVFRKLGYKVGLLSTVCVRIGDEQIEAVRTTPDALTLQYFLHRMVEEGCSYAFMEVSSHAVVQHRIGGTTFAGGIFTNLTHDHLDYHLTFDNYLRAKQGFFDQLSQDAFALTNVDDRNGMVMVQNAKTSVYTYGLKTDSTFKGKIIEKHLDGTEMLMDGTEIFTHFVGDFNGYNLMAVYGAARLLGVEKDVLLPVMSSLIPVNGRFQTIMSPRGFVAVVDYAHTPDALENVLHTVSDLVQGKGELITVVGCGGNRDKEKRPIMAAVGAKWSSKLILTSDNPRDEEPMQILKEMESGLLPNEKAQVLTIEDRKQAIKTACMLAKKGDVVLIAGKGHENYQEIRGEKYHFDDVEEVLDCYKSM